MILKIEMVCEAYEKHLNDSDTDSEYINSVMMTRIPRLSEHVLRSLFLLFKYWVNKTF